MLLKKYSLIIPAFALVHNETNRLKREIDDAIIILLDSKFFIVKIIIEREGNSIISFMEVTD